MLDEADAPLHYNPLPHTVAESLPKTGISPEILGSFQSANITGGTIQLSFCLHIHLTTAISPSSLAVKLCELYSYIQEYKPGRKHLLRNTPPIPQIFNYYIVYDFSTIMILNFFASNPKIIHFCTARIHPSDGLQSEDDTSCAAVHPPKQQQKE